MSAAMVFRVDGSASVGLGHVQRCLSLAAAAYARGREPVFVVNGEDAVIDRVRGAGWTMLPAAGASWSREDAASLAQLAAARSASIVVVDSDLDPPDFIQHLRAAGLFCCVVEDNSCDDVRAHVLVNGDAHAAGQTYRSATGDTAFLLGPAYSPVAPGFSDDVSAANVPARTVLLTLGGSDPCGLMPSLVEAAASMPSHLQWELVIGPFTGREDQIARVHEPIADRMRVHRAPAGMRDIIAASDVALTAAGQTLYELAAMGRPAVAIAVAGNQEPQLDAFVQSGAVLSAGRAQDAGAIGRAVSLLTDLLAQPDRLAAMGAAGRRFIDGRGAARVIDALIQRSLEVNA